EEGAAILHAAAGDPGSYNRPGPACRAGRGEHRPMVAQITLQEALGFSAVALLLGLMTMRWQLSVRRSVLVKLFMIVVGLGGLALLSRYELIPAHLAISVIPREICLFIVTLGNIQIWIAFLVNVLLAKRAVPRILGEVTMVVSLVVYALFRMDALGVNL